MYEQVSCSDTHCIGLADDGRAFTWSLTAAGTRFGQLCRLDRSLSSTTPAAVTIGQRVVAVGAGGGRDAGHTVLVGQDGRVFACGCDRWQQLGVSAATNDLSGNANGYTWRDGKLWQSAPLPVPALAGVNVCQVALGTDHTLALAANGHDVYAWGKVRKQTVYAHDVYYSNLFPVLLMV